MWLGSGGAVAVAVAGSYSSDSTPSLGTSYVTDAALKRTNKKKKQKKKKKKKERKKNRHLPETSFWPPMMLWVATSLGRSDLEGSYLLVAFGVSTVHSFGR